jgi:ribosomal RNA-processing protein 8
MFTVKGWSISTDNLKSEATGASAAATGSNSLPLQSKKRKRPNSKLKVTVTDENVADLWEKFVENKKPRLESGKQGDEHAADDKPELSAAEKLEKSEKALIRKNLKKARKEAKRKADFEGAPTISEQKPQEEDDDEWNGIDEEDRAEVGVEASNHTGAQEENPKKEKKVKKKGSNVDDTNTTQPAKQKTERALVPTTIPKPPAPKLTPLQASMREKLISARFRHLNETLYTRPSAEAFELFKTSPDMFVEYHEGFRRQVAVWPENPIDGYIADILARGRVRAPNPDRQHRHQRQQPQTPATGSKVPLPRARDGTCTIADLGCGDAKLAAALQAQARKLRLDVRSFDLQTNGNPLVTAADVANLPLADGSVDVAVFCLALMGTNWVDFVEEAYRVLRWKGELWVAEIKSRFTVPGKGGKKGGGVVEHSVGNRRKIVGTPPAVPGPKSKAAKAGRAEEAATAEADLAIEVDGAEDKRPETDVSAFVDVLAKRGFVLRGEPSEAVDLGNRMFVKMYFVKGATPVKGKGVEAARAREAAYPAKPAWKKKFITDDDVEVNESAVLKPCVYKIR